MHGMNTHLSPTQWDGQLYMQRGCAHLNPAHEHGPLACKGHMLIKDCKVMFLVYVLLPCAHLSPAHDVHVWDVYSP